VKILYLALTHDSQKYSTHREAQAKHLNLSKRSEIFWILGSETAKSPRLESPNFLLLPTKDNFENILHKTLLSVEWAISAKQFDFLVRTNTSTYFEDSKLRTHLLGNKKKVSFQENSEHLMATNL